MKLEKAILGREGLLGRHYIGGTDEERLRFERLKTRLNSRAIRARQHMAKAFQDSPHAFIAPDKGYATCPPGQFEEIDEVIASARSYIAAIDPLKVSSGMRNKPQLYTEILDSSQLTLDSPYLRFILRTDVLQTVSAYFGVVPILKDVDIWYSIYPGTPTFSNSQLYHCDWESIRQLKALVHVDDVTLDNGPLTVIPANVSEELRARFGYTYLTNNGKDSYGRLDDEQIQASIDTQDQATLTGPAGTVSFVDTGRCLHYGSRVTEKASRTLVQYQFLPPAAFSLPVNYLKRAPFRHLSHDGLPLLQRLVLGGTP